MFKRICYLLGLFALILIVTQSGAAQSVGSNTPVELSGWFNVLWGDGSPENPGSVMYPYVTTADGEIVTLQIDDADLDLEPLLHQQVRVTGHWLQAPDESGSAVLEATNRGNDAVDDGSLEGAGNITPRHRHRTAAPGGDHGTLGQGSRDAQFLALDVVDGEQPASGTDATEHALTHPAKDANALGQHSRFDGLGDRAVLELHVCADGRENHWLCEDVAPRIPARAVRVNRRHLEVPGSQLVE